MATWPRARRPASGRRAKKDHRERPWPTPEQVAAIVAAADGDWPVCFRLMAETGLRRGEAIGLRWGDLDPERRRLRVARSLGPHGESAPKTRAGGRLVPLTRATAEALRAHRLTAPRSGDGDPVFAHPGGGHQTPSNIHRAWRPACRKAGVRGLTLHTLRHYAASAFIRTGASVKTVQVVMGHASATLTLNLYAHLFDDDLDALAERVEAQAAAPAGQVVELGAKRGVVS